MKETKTQLEFSPIRLLALLLAGMLLLAVLTPCAAASETTVEFQKETYSCSTGDNLTVGIEITGSEPVVGYDITVAYDVDKLQCVGGAKETGEGEATLTGEGSKTLLETEIEFRGLSAGSVELEITEATLKLKSGEVVRVTSAQSQVLDTAKVTLKGDTVEKTAQQGTGSGEGQTGGSTIQILGNEFPAYVVWIAAAVLAALLLIILLAIRSGCKKRSQKAKTAQTPKAKKSAAKAENKKPETGKPQADQAAAKAQPAAPKETPKPVQETAAAAKPEPKAETPVSEKPVSEKPADEQPKEAAPPAKPAKKVRYRYFKPQPRINEDGTETPCIISAQHVTMKYKVATNNVSGLKEYMIKRVHNQISHRDLLALNDVNFNVYKGEVVGIIGRNGAGKSTLLRIVSGALRPTAGRIFVDHSKVQLLTLGTGFDMELTARENVYLNGSIIGYSQEFIDSHYDEIVEFAELEGFMEEKVKNFSSGMVSRLGFAIATTGGAAEILILDEVLSVGDEFFRKKSLARVKEMIHSGSTVLLVSHSMATVTEHCTKVIWLEHGEVQMIGPPKEVAKEYRKRGRENAKSN